MKLNYFYVTIEVAPRDGYYESLQCCTDRNDTSKLKFTFPYGEITTEQAAAVAEFSKTITDAFNVLQSQVNRINKKLQLEEYAPIVPPVVETTGSDFDLDVESAAPEEISPQQTLEELAALKKACSPEGSNSAQSSEVSTVEEKSLAKTIEDNVIESLGLK